MALYAIRAVSAVALVMLACTRPFATLLVPTTNAALWCLVMTIGERFPRWTA